MTGLSSCASLAWLRASCALSTTSMPASETVSGTRSLRCTCRKVHGQDAGPLAAGGISHCGAQLAHTHTSELLEKLVAQAPDGPVDLDWLLGHLDKRSFGLLLLLLGLLVIVPGVASIASLIVLFPSVEIMLGRSRPTFPQFLSRRPFDFKRFKRLAERVQPALRAIEKSEPTSVDAASRRGRPSCRSRRIPAGVVGRLAPAVGERHPGSDHRPHRDRLPAGGRPPSGGSRRGGVSVVGGLRMDVVDVGRSRDAVGLGIRRRSRTAAPMRSPLPSSRKGRS